MYESFGFKSNIFNIRPLDPCQEDLQRFVGRVQDIKSFVVDVSAADRALIIVTGHRGVGKTSFVNVMEYAVGFDKPFLTKHIEVSLPELIPCFHKMQLEPDDDVKTVLSKSLFSLLFSIKKFAEDRAPALKIPKEIRDMIEWVSKPELDEEWSGQLTAAGFGGGVSRSKRYKHISEMPANALQEKISRAVRLAAESFNKQGIFLNINNVDILEEKKICNLFNHLRDYLFNTKGLWNIVIGPPGLYSSLYQQAARVAETVSGQETKLAPLSEEDMIQVLRVRQKTDSKNPKRPADLPIEEEFIREIYKNSDGEIRQVFKSCDDVLKYIFKENPNIKSISSKSGRPALKNILETQLSYNRLKEKEKEIIREILKRGSLRPKDYQKLKMKSAVDFTNKAARLLSQRFLKKEIRGSAADYKVTGVIHLAKYAGVEI